MPNCAHSHTRLVAKDKDAEYIECLDCGAVLETGELPGKPAPTNAAAETDKEKQGPEGPSETLSDA